MDIDHQHLGQQFKEIQVKYNLISEKIEKLKMEFFIETYSSLKFKLYKEIKECEEERDRFVNQIRIIESELRRLKTTSQMRSHRKVEFKLRISKDNFDVECFKSVLSNILRTDKNFIPIISIEQGSTRVIIKLPSDKAAELEKQFIIKSEGIRQLDDQFGLNDIEVKEFDLLVIDDSKMWQEIVMDTFKTIYSCDVASNYEEAIIKIQVKRYKVICLTIPFLTHNKGRNVLISLKMNHPDLPVILIITFEEKLEIQNRYPNIKKIVIKGQKYFIDDLANAISEIINNCAVSSMSNNPSVFICHANANKDDAESLYKKIENAGFKPWLDKKNLRGGDKWDTQIEYTIRKEIDYFIVLQSKALCNRYEGYVNKEIKLALERHEHFTDGAIFIIPVKIEECELREEMRHLHTLDISNKENLNKLIQTIKDDYEMRNNKK